MLRCSSAREGVAMGPVPTHPEDPPPADGSSPLDQQNICPAGVLLQGQLVVPFLGGLSLLMLV